MDQNKKSYLTLLKKQKKEKSWDTMLVSAQEAIAAFPDDKRFWRLLHHAQVHYVDEKLNSDLVHDLEAKEDLEALLQVYHRLLMVFPESKKLKKRIELTSRAQEQQAMKEREEALAEANQKIEKYIEGAQFEEALTSCYEILAYLPNHKKTLRLKSLAIRKRDKIIDQDLGRFFEKSYSLILEEKNEDGESVISI